MPYEPGRTLADIEKEVILQAYRFYDSNKTRTAQALGIAIRTLDYKLEAYANEPKPNPPHLTFTKEGFKNDGKPKPSDGPVPVKEDQNVAEV